MAVASARRVGSARWEADAVTVGTQSPLVILPGIVAAWRVSGVSLAGLTDLRPAASGRIAARRPLAAAAPDRRWPDLIDAALDTVAMAIRPWSSRSPSPWSSAPGQPAADAAQPPTAHCSRSGWRRGASWPGRTGTAAGAAVGSPYRLGRHRAARAVPRCPARGAGLGVYTGGILGRLVAEAWEGVDTRARDTLPTPGCATVWPRWPRRFRRPRIN